MAGGVPGRQLTGEYTEMKNLYYVLGEVKSPGTKTYEEGLDLFDALGAANGTTGMADLANVRVISKQGEGSTVIRVNLQEFQDRGQTRRLFIKPEDTIVIGQKKGSLLSWGTLRDFVAVAGAVISLVYLIDR
jgi:protein involved in polysaccharide export with SLBB domain